MYIEPQLPYIVILLRVRVHNPFIVFFEQCPTTTERTNRRSIIRTYVLCIGIRFSLRRHTHSQYSKVVKIFVLLFKSKTAIGHWFTAVHHRVERISNFAFYAVQAFFFRFFFFLIFFFVLFRFIWFRLVLWVCG